MKPTIPRGMKNRNSSTKVNCRNSSQYGWMAMLIKYICEHDIADKNYSSESVWQWQTVDMDHRPGPRGSEDITWSVGNIKVRSSSKIAFNFEQIEPNIAEQLLEPPQQAGFPPKMWRTHFAILQAAVEKARLQLLRLFFFQYGVTILSFVKRSFAVITCQVITEKQLMTERNGKSGTD